MIGIFIIRIYLNSFIKVLDGSAIIAPRCRKNEALALSGEPSCGLSFRQVCNFMRGLHVTARVCVPPVLQVLRSP